MLRTIVATKNTGKIEEIREILAIDGLELLTFEDVEGWPEVEETGSSFYENAIIKARALVEKFELAAIADDSGLEVDALGGAPGIMSARFSGENASDVGNNVKLLRDLGDLPVEKRTARFRCAAVFLSPTGHIFSADGALEGHIGFAPHGTGGFGYDPLFIPEGYDKTLAELGPEIKNQISHRARAFHLLKLEIEETIKSEQ